MRISIWWCSESVPWRPRWGVGSVERIGPSSSRRFAKSKKFFDRNDWCSARRASTPPRFPSSRCTPARTRWTLLWVPPTDSPPSSGSANRFARFRPCDRLCSCSNVCSSCTRSTTPPRAGAGAISSSPSSSHTFARAATRPSPRGRTWARFSSGFFFATVEISITGEPRWRRDGRPA